MRVIAATILLVFMPTLILSNNEANINERIFNGANAVRGQFPFQARCVQYDKDGSGTLCGGSVISKKWILSAAHCGSGMSYVKVLLGLIDTENMTGVYTGYTEPDKGIFVHPKYDKSIQNYDVALYKLNQSIPFDKYPYIGIIALPTMAMTDASYFDNYNGTIIGLGQIDNNGSHPQIMQWAPAHIMPHKECEEANYYPITENIICTDKTVFNTGLCPGDSGGPLAVNTTDGVLRVIGTGSWISGGCNSTYSVQYGFVGSKAILSWILATTGIKPS